MAMARHMTTNGLGISLLGYGSMRLPTKDGHHANGWVKEGYSESPIDQELVDRQVRYLLDHGVNYFDSSPAYCRGESERRLGEALAKSGYARKDYVVATKLSNFAPHQYPLAECRKMFEGSLAAFRTDYIDNYLLHAIGNGGFESFQRRFVSNGAVDWLAGERAAGRIRNLGFSYHGDPKALEWCLANHDRYKWDFAMIQMNFVDWRHAKEVNARNLNAEYLYGELTKRGIRVAVMEPLLGGALARFNVPISRELTPLDPEASQAKWALRFCASHPNVMTVISGMTRMEHVEENVAVFENFRPCTEEEFAALERAAVAYLACGNVPCTACAYCMPCPYGLDIPALLRFRNEFLSAKSERRPAAELLAAYAKAVPEELRRADHCTGCEICRAHCPQQINIPDEIASLDRVIDLLKDEVARK